MPSQKLRKFLAFVYLLTTDRLQFDLCIHYLDTASQFYMRVDTSHAPSTTATARLKMLHAVKGKRQEKNGSYRQKVTRQYSNKNSVVLPFNCLICDVATSCFSRLSTLHSDKLFCKNFCEKDSYSFGRTVQKYAWDFFNG